MRIEKRRISRDKKIHLPEAPIGAEYIVHVLADGKIVLSPHRDNQPEFIVLDNKIQPVKNIFYRKLKELVEKYRKGGLSSEETALAESMMEKSQEAYAAVWAAHKDTIENDLE